MGEELWIKILHQVNIIEKVILKPLRFLDSSKNLVQVGRKPHPPTDVIKVIVDA
jgi:hypothetical protein